MPVRPIIVVRCLRNKLPCSPFVSVSASISAVPLWTTSVISPLLNLSVMKKYLMLMCFVRFVLDRFPFLCRSIELVLSCSTITVFPRLFNFEFSGTVRACSRRKYFIHKIKVMASSTPTNSASVELRVVIFCFDDSDRMLPCPNVQVAPV